MEITYPQQTQAIGTNAATNVLDHRQGIQTLSDQQITYIQNHIKTHLDV
jgi:hypothetical protein